jgi:hypothetical protein
VAPSSKLKISFRRRQKGCFEKKEGGRHLSTISPQFLPENSLTLFGCDEAG